MPFVAVAGELRELDSHADAQRSYIRLSFLVGASVISVAYDGPGIVTGPLV